MKKKLNPVPAANRTQEKINDARKGHVELMPEEAQKLVTGIYELDAKVKLKDSQILTITKEKSDLQQLVKTKTSEIQSKNSLLVQKDNLINQKITELQSKDSLLLQKEQLLSELRIKEENQLKEEYISVLHQLNPKIFSANYEDWSGKAQGFKDIIDQGKFKTIRKKLPVYKQQLAQNIETEKLALVAKEVEKLDKAKGEVVSILNQLHPHSYPANFEEWSTHPATQNSRAKELLDSNNLGAIEKKLVHYRELLKQEVQNKAQLILQKEEEFKSLNDTFTSSILTKEEELKSLHDTILAKNTAISEVSHKVKKKNRKLAQEIQSKNQLALQKAMEEEIRIQKEQEIERLRELLAQNEIQTQELLARQELEKQELLIQKENELREKDELLLVKESEIHNKSAEKNRIIEELTSNLLTKEEVIVSKDLKIGEGSHKVKKANRKLAAKNKLLNDKEQRLEELKALIEQAKIENEELLTQVANKSHMKNQIIDELEEEVNLQKDEVVNLRIQNLERELIAEQNEKLLIQKEMELADKSLVKNQLIKEAKKLLAQKDNEFQNLLDHNTELVDQNEVLDLKMQFYDKEVKNKEAEKEILLTQKQKLSFLVSQKEQEFQNLLIQKEIEQKELLIAKEMAVSEKSFAKNQVIDQLQEDITNLKQQLLDNQPIYRSIYIEDRSCQPGESLVERQMASLDLSSINLSLIDHGGQNQIVGNILGNFDNQHITHSIPLGGESSESFEII
ncbi:MAG: hypothetical protein FJX70_07380 [Alphaproteobacteria bacterium]|nr:hypothetical protein [Alphaproteobacteria bacterium]